MKVVKVHGALKERLGEGTFYFNVDTPAQAIKALCVNFQGLEKWIIDSEQDGISYKVLIGKEEVTRDSLEMLELPWSEQDVFSITPVFTGAGRGFGRFVLGAALILTGWGMAAGAFGAGVAAAKIGTFGLSSAVAVSTVVKTAGVMLALNGVSEMLTPLPQMPKDPSRNESFGFGGVINTTGQGHPVPVAYGRLFVGSAPISVSLDVDQVDIVNPSLSSSSPSDNATAVAVDSNIVLTFSEAVEVKSGNILIKKSSNNSTIETIDVTSGQVTGSGTATITINPSVTLAAATEYYVQIEDTAFDDLAGNSYAGINNRTSLSFTTAG